MTLCICEVTGTGYTDGSATSGVTYM